MRGATTLDTLKNQSQNFPDSLDLYEFPDVRVCEGRDDIENIVYKFRNHPSIIKIKERYKVMENFSFRLATTEEIKAIIRDPISVLPLLSKVFERVIYNQLGKYMNTFLNKLLCGFRKAHSNQHALFKLLQRWQNELDNSGLVGTILMDLSKAYDCLPHDLIIAKFEAYGLSKSSLSLLLDYLTSRKQRVKIGSSYSIWNEIKRGVPQGSILGPLLFNAFINIIMFIEKTEICNFADDNTIYDCGEDLSNILENLKHDLKILLKWFRINSLQANPGKFQFMILGKKKRNSAKLIINTTEIEERRKVLIFNEHTVFFLI